VNQSDWNRAIDRFVAGLDFDDADVAAAVAARAIDRATAMRSVMRGLRHPEGVVRIRAADRVARMEAFTPAVIVTLTLIGDADLDQRARAAAARALRGIAASTGSG
jgi:hypothetical protein